MIGSIYQCPKCGRATKGCVLDEPCHQCTPPYAFVGESRAVSNGDAARTLYMEREELKKENASLKQQLAEAARELSKASTRFRAIKHQHECIGLTLCHVDFNCIYCLANYSEKQAELTLAKLGGKVADK